MIHQTRNYDASCVIVSGFVKRIALHEHGEGQATQYDTLFPKL